MVQRGKNFQCQGLFQYRARAFNILTAGVALDGHKLFRSEIREGTLLRIYAVAALMMIGACVVAAGILSVLLGGAIGFAMTFQVFLNSFEHASLMGRYEAFHQQHSSL